MPTESAPAPDGFGHPEQGEIDRVHRSLTNVTPSPEGIARIEVLRTYGRELATAIITKAPASRERSLALTHLETAVMWAVKSIVLEPPVVADPIDPIAPT